MNNLNDIFFAPAANQDLTYEQILEDVQRYFAENHAATIAEAGDGNTDRASSLLKELMVQYIVKRKYAIEGLTTEELCEKLYEDMAGYSFLKKWIYKPGIEEVNINAYNDIEVIEAGGRSVKIPDKFSSPQHAIDVVRRMLNACGMVIDDTMPSVIGFLDKNVRRLLPSLFYIHACYLPFCSLIYPQSRFRHLGDKKASMTKGKTPVVHSCL